MNGVKAQPVLSPGPWSQMVAVKDVLCPDGKRRMARVGIPDTYFSVPARIKVQGKTVSGFVSSFGDEGDMEFIPNRSGRNGGIFGRWRSGHLLPETAPAESEWYWSHVMECFASFSPNEWRVMGPDGTLYASSYQWYKVQESRNVG